MQQDLPTSTRETVAAAVRAVMAARRISGVQLADRAGMSQSAFSRRVTGETSFSTDELAAIARCLAVPIAVLFVDPNAGTGPGGGAGTSPTGPGGSGPTNPPPPTKTTSDARPARLGSGLGEQGAAGQGGAPAAPTKTAGRRRQSRPDGPASAPPALPYAGPAAGPTPTGPAVTPHEVAA